MNAEFWLLLLAKMVLTALVVVSASFVAERSRPVVGALIATLPVSGGPVLIFLAAEHGPDFLYRATFAGLPACGLTAIFILTYAMVAPRRGLPASLALSYAAWLLPALVVLSIEWSLAGAVLFNVAIYAVCYLVARRIVPDVRAPLMPRRWWDIPARAAAVMSIVAVVMISAELIGPRVAGTAAFLPVVLASLAIILHPRIGGAATAAIVGRALPGMMGFTTGLAVVHLTVLRFGSTVALSLGLVTCVLWNLALLLGSPAGPPRPAPVEAEAQGSATGA